MRPTDVDDDSLRVEALGDECGIDYKGCAMERLRAAKYFAAKRMSDHDMVTNFHREHWNTSLFQAAASAEQYVTSWQSTPVSRKRISGSRIGRSRNATAGAISESSCESASRSIAAASRPARVHADLCDGAT